MINLRSLLTEILKNEIPQELYHVTFRKYAKNITTNGLVPGGIENKLLLKFFRIFNRNLGVYLCDDVEISLKYIMYREGVNINELVVFKIFTENLDHNLFEFDKKLDKRLVVDGHVVQSFIYKGVISPDNIILAWPQN